MKTPIVNFNTVMVGENFPVQTVQVSDFEFRGRKFQEQMRVGPALQAGSRGVTMLALPDRFQVNVLEPDDLDIQAVGVRQVARTFQEYLGRRSVTHVGHNAQVCFPPEAYPAAIEALTNRAPIRDILGLQGDPAVLLVYAAEIGAGVQLKLQLAEQAVTGKLQLDFNFDYDLTSGDLSLDDALDGLRASLQRVEEVHQDFQSKIIGGRVAT